MTKRTKYSIALASIIAGVSPLAFAIGCSSSSTNYDLKIGIRPEDAKMWKPVVAQFEKVTGKKLKLIFVNNQIVNYKLWHSSGNIPDVTLADSGASQKGMEQEWFQALNLKDIFENAKYKIKTTGDWAQKNIKFNDDNFEMAMMQVNLLRTSSNFSSAAVIYGPKITYAWRKVPSKTSGAEIDLFDGTKELEWYVPNKLGNGVESVSWSGSRGENNPLYSLKDNHRLKNTIADIQEFMSRAIAENDLKFNANVYNANSLTNNDPKKRVIATGMPGYKQRMASIGKVLYDYAKEAGNTPETKIGAFADNAIAYANIALGKAQYQNTKEKVVSAGHNLDAKVKLDESKVFSGVSGIQHDSYKIRIDKTLNTQGSQMTELEVINYLSIFGYHGLGVRGNSGIFGLREDAQVGFGKRLTLMVPNGALWQKDSIYAKIKDKLSLARKEDVAQKIAVFSQPIQETGVDGYAISSKSKGDRLLLAKKFLRFIFQKKAAATITGTKAISTLKSAQTIQEAADDSIQNAIANAGTKWFVANNKKFIKKMPWAIAKSTYNSEAKKENEKSIYDPYNDNFMNGALFAGNSHFTPTQTMTKIKEYNKKFLDALST